MIFDSYNLKGKTIKNRIVFPPIAVLELPKHRHIAEGTIEHYRKVAQSGVGLIVTEAACISPTGSLGLNQIGIYDDSFIEGFAKIAEACHAEGAVVIAQIQHAGVRSVTPPLFAPSDTVGEDGKTPAHELSIAQIEELENIFVAAAIRAKAAGLDGIELHAAHGYMLSYFHSSNTNLRTDQYGGSAQNRARLTTDIMRRVRTECGDDFIIGIRYGGASPTLDDGIALAQEFEAAGCDILHISHGASPDDKAAVPPEFADYNPYIYSAIAIKKHVRIPVIASNEITTLERAKALVDGGHLDFASIGKSILADYDWLPKSIAGEKPNPCLKCNGCKWFRGPKANCPAAK